VNVPSTNVGLYYSARLLVPFLRLMQRRGDVPEVVQQRLSALDPDERIPIAVVHQWLTAAVEMTGNPDIGLQAAREVVIGDYGAVEYAARSAATWGDVCAVVGRYMRLINDALNFSLHSGADRSFIQLKSNVELPRAAADFQSGAFFVSASHFWPPGAKPDFEAWFTHSRPNDLTEYERTFPGGVLRFDAAFNGFVFDHNYLSVPVTSADPSLHALIRQHADAMLAELPSVQSITDQVRKLITKELAGGNPTVTNIARQMPMGERTLARRLADEGTTFKELLDDLRHRLALGYVSGSLLPLSEIAFLLGFSQTAAFHRAFKRWTGETPLEYRKAHRD
jgi:AraC-like DNA-binding protein